LVVVFFRKRGMVSLGSPFYLLKGKRRGGNERKTWGVQGGYYVLRRGGPEQNLADRHDGNSPPRTNKSSCLKTLIGQTRKGRSDKE